MELVLRPRAAAAGAGADLPPRLAVRRPGRARGRARRLLHLQRRRRARRGHARPRGRAARAAERLPPPRLARRLRAAETAPRCSAPTTRGRTSSTAACARPPRGPELELDGICLRELAVETWGPLRLRQPRRRGAAARRDARPTARAAGRRRDRARAAALPPARRVRAGLQLEDRGRELPRVLPLRRGASGLQPGRRRLARTRTGSRRTHSARASSARAATAAGRSRASSTGSGR